MCRMHKSLRLAAPLSLLIIAPLFVGTVPAAAAVESAAVQTSSGSGKELTQNRGSGGAGEDEDAFVQIHKTGEKDTVGTGWLNQVRLIKPATATRKSKVKRNVVTGWLTFYGLSPNTGHVMYIGQGNCPKIPNRIGKAVPITTNSAGAWSGKIKFNLKPHRAWVVRGKHSLVIAQGDTVSDSVAACGLIRDDPDNAE